VYARPPVGKIGSDRGSSISIGIIRESEEIRYREFHYGSDLNE
jgi:hypothetical protein